jgi:hypothetical protein
VGFAQPDAQNCEFCNSWSQRLINSYKIYMKNKRIMFGGMALLVAFALLAPLYVNASEQTDGSKMLENKPNIGVSANVGMDRNDDGDRDDKNKTEDGSKDKIKNKDNDKKENKGWFNGGWFKYFTRWFRWGSDSVIVTNITVKNMEVTDTTMTTANIRWDTNASTTAEVRYTTNASLIKTTPNVVTVSTLALSQNIIISGLSSDTRYFYQINVKDVNGNTKSSGVLHFDTKANTVIDTTAPVILFSTVLNVQNNSARIIWVTDELSNSKVWVSTNGSISTDTNATESVGAMTYLHDVKVSGLNADTKYYFKFKSADAKDNTVVSVVGTFTTTK